MCLKNFAVNSGLSPRVRRNLVVTREQVETFGSISACAEEPQPFWMSRDYGKVYLRVCGGTSKCVPAAVEE